MKILYVVGFPVTGNSGKQKATREKKRALENNSAVKKIKFISEKEGKTLFNKVLLRLLLDIKSSVFLIKNNDYILIHRAFFLPLTLLCCRFLKISVISEFHADLKEEIPLLMKSKLESRILHLMVYFNNLNFKLSDKIIFNHPYLKDKFENIYKKPSIYSYNGANVVEFFVEDRLRSRQILNIPKSATICLFLGSVSQWHGVDYLIDIFNQEIIRENKNIYLYIVGANDNPFTRELKKRIININIIFVPPVDANDARKFINASDFCVLPVKQNRSSPGSPIKLYDYIACGKPVITQENLKGYSDEVLEYNLGFVTDLTNAELAANFLLNKVFKSSVDFEINNRFIAENHLSWDKRMEKWVNFLK